VAADSFRPGSLWERVVRTTEAARRLGSLQPIPTRCELLTDPATGVRFQLRTTDAQDRKEAEQASQEQQAATGSASNPFAHPDPHLWVAGLTDTHYGLLNKFPVVHHHLLLVTRRYQPQSEPLNAGDCHALAAVLSEFRGLGFFNAGEAAGASQGHKHLQVAPLPLGGDDRDLPLAPLLREAALGAEPRPVSALPFRHAAVGLTAAGDGDALLAAYAGLCEALELDPARDPYNLLVTSEWMLLVPRSRGEVDGIPLNALAYAGALMVRNDAQRAELLERGPWWLLTAAADSAAT
jgi:ATP adenylyltransferase